VRIALEVAYDGSGYHGWQRQAEGVATVQADVENALRRIADEPVSVTCAGRTDTGVHALGQVIHFDTTREREIAVWLRGTNALLPSTVSVQWAGVVPASFDARRSARYRRYNYVIHNASRRHALFAHHVTREHRKLDAHAMHDAAQALVGEHDFSAFRAANCQSRTPFRNVMAIAVTRRRDFVVIDVRASAFLHHMVRNIAGVLIEIGAGRRARPWAGEVLASRDRTQAGETAPPSGLYLREVGYDDPALRGRPDPRLHFFALLPGEAPEV